jgi:molybdopterin-guanine dinucleotide biosynthesis protein A
MGRDKALLPHPEGGTWLERSLLLLAELGAPVTLLSRHPRHLEMARALAAAPLPITAVPEPSPWEGPLLALHRLMALYPGQLLLLCPVDMPALTGAALRQLLAAANAEPTVIHLAHDGRRLQPLLGLYPSGAAIRSSLAAAVAAGERRLQGWL